MRQIEALAILHAGHTVFLTGAAGSGKTYVLNRFIEEARSMGKSVAVTASTGLAATHLGGNTIHAWSGIGIGDELRKKHVGELPKGRRELITKADILIIDEVSMLHDFRLDMVEEVCRIVRDKPEPFGGLQVVLSGDFYQLPPINRDNSRSGGFVVHSQAWQTTKPVICYLDEQHRQSKDMLLEILTALRDDDVRRRHAEALLQQVSLRTPFDEQVTELYTRNIDVDAVNSQRLSSIPGDIYEYYMDSSGKENAIESLKKACLAPETLRLKKGALVMFVKNSLEKKYVNGTIGTVIEFDTNTELPIVETKGGRTVEVRQDTWELRDGDKKVASIAQLPLRLAWAITVHKSQGMTLDAAHMDLRNAFVPGMGYVALSRVKSLASLSLAGINRMALTMSKEAHAIDKILMKRSEEDAKKYSHLVAPYELVVERFAKNKKQTSSRGQSWQEKLVKMRTAHPNAYKPWKELEDKTLISLWENGKTITEMSSALGRHKGSITARLKKLTGVDAGIDVGVA